MCHPSVLAHIVNGIVLLIAIVLFFHYYTKMDNNEIVFSIYWYSRVITFRVRNALYFSFG